MAGSNRSGSPVKMLIVGLLLAVNAALIGLNVVKYFDLFGPSSEEAIVPADSSSTGGVESEGSDAEGDAALNESGWSIESALGPESTCDNPAVGDPILIGYAADFGQVDNPADFPASEAAQHLATRITCNGGVNGRPVQVDVVDIADDFSKVQDLINSGAIAILGPPSQDSGLAVLRVTGGNVPVVFTTSTEPALSDRSLLSFSVTFDYQRGAAAAATFAIERQWSRAVLFTGQENDYYSLSPSAFRSTYEGQGGQVIGDYSYTAGESADFREAIDQFADDPPDVIYSAMLAPQAAALRAQLKARGLESVELIAADSLESSGAYFTPGLNGVYHTAHAFPSPGGGVERLNRSIEGSTGAGSSSPTFAALAGDAMAIILHAFATTNSENPRTIGEAIALTSGVQGVTGVLSYDEAGKPTKPVYMHQVIFGEPFLVQEVAG